MFVNHTRLTRPSITYASFATVIDYTVNLKLSGR